jgi:hypothetical protein
MQGKFFNLKQPIKFSLGMCGLLLCFCVLPVQLPAQGAAAKAPHCIAINVRLNGQAIDGPQAITLKTRKVENTVSLEKTCFKVPDAVVESELIEVSFTVPGNKIHMSDIPTDFLNGMWDVDLADKKFAKDVAVPKHASASEVCAVVVHGGDAEQSMAQSQCRTPLATK